MKINIDWNKLGSAVGYLIASGAVAALLPQPYKQYAALAAMAVGILHPSPFTVSPVEQEIVGSLKSATTAPSGTVNLDYAIRTGVPAVTSDLLPASTAKAAPTLAAAVTTVANTVAGSQPKTAGQAADEVKYAVEGQVESAAETVAAAAITNALGKIKL